LILCYALVVGCGSSANHPAPSAPKQKPVLQQPLVVNSISGEATIRSNHRDRQVLYHIHWKKAAVDVSDIGLFAGNMDDVEGEMYRKGKVVSTFTADHASANRDQQLLVLTGRVHAVSTTEKAAITCDRLEWHAAEEIAKAFGHIEVHGERATLSGLDEVWATPDLNYLATPSMFKRPPTPKPKRPKPASNTLIPQRRNALTPQRPNPNAQRLTPNAQ